MNPDAETQKLRTDADEIRATISGTGWRIIEEKLKAKILDLQNIENIDESNLAIDLKARIMASRLLFGWLKDDVYGFVQQQDANRAPSIDTDEGHIVRE